MRWYEVEYRLSVVDDSADPNAWHRLAGTFPEGTTDIHVPGDVGERYDVRVRLHDDVDRIAGPWTTYGGVLVEKPGTDPPAPARVRMTKGDCLTWEPYCDRRNLRGYKVRHAPGRNYHWGTSEPAHEDLVMGAPLTLCRVPKGQRTYLVRAVDADGRESVPALVVADRGPMDDTDEFVLRTDAQHPTFASTKQGATVIGDELLADAVSSVPAWPSGLEPAWSVTALGNIPAWSHGEAPAWGGLFGGACRWWSGDPVGPAWTTMWRWLEYRWTFQVGAADAGDDVAMTADVVADGPPWRLSYRKRHATPYWSDVAKNPAWGDGTDPAWSDTCLPFMPWPGRLDHVRAGRYDFRLLVAGGKVQGRVSELSVSLSVPRRVYRATVASVPSGGGRVAPPVPFRFITDVSVRVPGAADLFVPVHDKDRTNGPDLHPPATGGLVVTMTGHGSRE